MIESFIASLFDLIEQRGYLGVFLSMIIENVFPPIPSELILPFVGFVASKGSLSFGRSIFWATIGAYLGTLPFYFLGYRGNRDTITAFVNRHGKWLGIAPSVLTSGFDLFERYGLWFMFFGRLVPIIRSVVSFPAGTVRLNFLLYTLVTLGGGFLWSFLLIWGGFVLGQHYAKIFSLMETYKRFLVIPFVLIACGMRLWWWKKNARP
ncbi:MAG: DedA family protein [Candidatus Absconditabacterales bacterium]|nr:DedA family protein [Candidatus Absconditabacterales bacterium]